MPGMRPPARLTPASLLICGAIFCNAFLACRTGVCPDIGCRPEIELIYRQPIAGDYALLISLRGVTYQATCPTADAPYDFTPHVACDAHWALLSGVDLGHGSNDPIGLTLEFVTGDAATTVAVAARLDHVINSRDCDLVCYAHNAIVENQVGN